MDDEVVDLTHPSIGMSGDMIELLASGRSSIERAETARRGGPRFALEDVDLVAPVPRPPKVLAIGMNYADHIAEMGRDAPDYQYWFNKQRTCVVGPGSPIVVPRVSTMVDYEGELAMVIGRRSRYLTVDEALGAVAGYTVMNDVSVRDWQWRSPSFTMGKSFDTHGPMGPWIVTPDEVSDPQQLQVRTWVNETLRQDSSTSRMIFSCAEQIAHLSTGFTLEVGDVVLTGTPAGVGAASEPPRWLVAGDVVRIEIERIGTLSNPVVSDAVDL